MKIGLERCTEGTPHARLGGGNGGIVILANHEVTKELSFSEETVCLELRWSLDSRPARAACSPDPRVRGAPPWPRQSPQRELPGEPPRPRRRSPGTVPSRKRGPWPRGLKALRGAPRPPPGSRLRLPGLLSPPRRARSELPPPPAGGPRGGRRGQGGAPSPLGHRRRAPRRENGADEGPGARTAARGRSRAPRGRGRGRPGAGRRLPPPLRVLLPPAAPAARSLRPRRAEGPAVRGAGSGLRDGELAPRRRQWPRRNRPPPLPAPSRRGRRARPACPTAGGRAAGGGGRAGQVAAAGRWRPRARAARGGGAGGRCTGSRWCSSACCSAGPTTPTPSSCASVSGPAARCPRAPLAPRPSPLRRSPAARPRGPARRPSSPCGPDAADQPPPRRRLRPLALPCPLTAPRPRGRRFPAGLRRAAPSAPHYAPPRVPHPLPRRTVAGSAEVPLQAASAETGRGGCARAGGLPAGPGSELRQTRAGTGASASGVRALPRRLSLIHFLKI